MKSLSKKEIKQYKVIENSQKQKNIFDKVIESDNYIILGTFQNENNELFVLYKHLLVPSISITGDEFSWSMSYEYDKGIAFIPFILTSDENTKIMQLLSEFAESLDSK